jgi:hypothetical protein
MNDGQARIDAMRKMLDKGESDKYSEPEVEEQPKPKSSVDDLKAKFMKKK